MIMAQVVFTQSKMLRDHFTLLLVFSIYLFKFQGGEAETELTVQTKPPCWKSSVKKNRRRKEERKRKKEKAAANYTE